MDEDNRFRRALKSPIVVVGLCIFAGLAVYHNIVESTMDSTFPVSVASTPVQTVSTSTPLPFTPRAHDEIAIQWIDHPIRDPFAPMSVVKWSKPSSPSSSTAAASNPRSPGSPFNNLILKAVAIEAQQRSAVINRQVVYEGESIEGYQIVSIQLKGVWIQRQGKKKFLTFTTNSISS